MTVITTAKQKLVNQVVSDLDRHEGFREFAYPDPLSLLFKKNSHLKWGFAPAREIAPPNTDFNSGKPWTVGYGDTLGVGPDHRTDKLKATRRLEQEVLEIDAALANIFGWYSDTSIATKTVMINMTYNLGLKGFLGFKNTIRYIKEKQYAQAAANMQKSLWAKQVGRRASELARRMSTQEIPEQFLTG